MSARVRRRRGRGRASSPLRACAWLALALVCGCKAEARDLPVEPPPPPPPPDVASSVKLVQVASGLRMPVWMTWAPGDPQSRLFVVEKTGTVRVLRRAAAAGHEPARALRVDAAPFLDVGPRLSSGTEQGLLGLAFHPRFASTHRLYIYWTDKHDNIHVSQLTLPRADADRVPYESEREILYIKHPFNNHNGGQLVFGPDGKLYIGTGDGGWGNDPFGNAQNRSSRLGKMLRLDVDAARPEPETIMIGLRNPWRYDFDRKTGDLYIADVGQDRYEEIDVVPHDHIGGQNFGWNVMEGLHCRKGDRCDRNGLVLPVAEYNHKAGCSITGGFVYRGRALPLLDGIYFYADYCTAMVRSLRWRDGKVSDPWEWRPLLDPEMRLSGISSFAEDPDGELYIISLEGSIYQLVPR